MKTVKIMLMKFQGGTRTLTGNWTRGHLCNILKRKKEKKNLIVFCPCPKILNETEFRSNGLIHFVKEISRQY